MFPVVSFNDFVHPERAGTGYGIRYGSFQVVCHKIDGI